MRLRPIIVASLIAATVVPAGAGATSAATTQLVRDGGVTALVTPFAAALGSSLAGRTWALRTDGTVQATHLVGPGQRDWQVAPGPDFQVDIDGVPTSSTTGWVLTSVTARRPPALPGRPASDRGAALLFRYALGSTAVAAASVEVDRLVVLHPGSTVFETTTTLVDHGPTPVRIAAYSLDQVVADPRLPVEVQAYNDGSDWRDDYRHVSAPTGAFDAEGEVARWGRDAGFFLVSQRRGGVMSRVGRDAGGRSWIGVDWARDLFDFGPLRDQPPSYNRLDNPAYPAPVRARVVPPLGTLDLGTSYLGVYAGGAAEAAGTFARDFVGGAEPAFARSVALNTFHPWGHGPGMSDANLRHQVDVAAALGADEVMLDDQWQGGPGGESGDWQFDPARFPDRNHDGVPDFVAYLHRKGLHLALWMSPLEFNGGSHTYAAHRDWACTPVGDATAQVQDDAGLGVWDATNPAFQDYLVGVIDRLVRDYDVREFKFDFLTWVDCPPHDYADYEDAFVAIVHRMQARHPHVTFEIDETNDQRAWPFESAAIGPSWFDNAHLHGSGPVAKLLHDVWSASPWIPTWSLGVGTYDGTLAGPYAGTRGVDALFPLAMLTHVTFWTDLTKLTPGQRRETAWWTRWYDAHRDDIGPAVYELTSTDPLDGRSWAAWEPWRGDHGYVFAFRQAGGAASVPLRLEGLRAAAAYVVRDARTGRSLGTFTGARLADGLRVTLPRWSAAVLSITLNQG